MNNWEGRDRRKFPRVNYPCLIIVRAPDEEPEMILTHTQNVGVGGMCVVIKKDIPLFTPVDLEIDLMDTGNHLKCHGKVVWAIRRKAEEKNKPLFYDVGIEFLEMAPSEYKRLDEIVHHLDLTEKPR